MNENQPMGGEPPQTILYDLRVTVERIEGRSFCGLKVGDFFELRNSNELQIPPGKHFCIYALQSVLPLLPAKQRQLPEGDWLERDSLVACPDPDERRVATLSEKPVVTGWIVANDSEGGCFGDRPWLKDGSPRRGSPH